MINPYHGHLTLQILLIKLQGCSNANYLSKPSTNTKTSAYLLLRNPTRVRVCLYCAGPTLYNTYIYQLWRRFKDRCALMDYNYHNRVNTMLTQLKWPSLTQRRKQFRLNFYQIMYGLIGIPLHEYCLLTSQFIRDYHPLHLIIPSY